MYLLSEKLGQCQGKISQNFAGYRTGNVKFFEISEINAIYCAILFIIAQYIVYSLDPEYFQTGGRKEKNIGIAGRRRILPLQSENIT